MERSKLKRLQKNLGYKFKRSELLVQALTHPSFVQGTEQSDMHNQRLEFLGDAVIGMIVAGSLYKKYPDRREGFLTKARSIICQGRGLTKLAKTLELGDYLQLGPGEKKAHSDRSQILGDCLEAVIGAIYLDGGFRNVHKIVTYWVQDQLQQVATEMHSINHKGALQEWAQSQMGANPFTYELVKSSGPAHAMEFHVKIALGERSLSEANGFSKKEAETSAAKTLLHRLKSEPQFRESIIKTAKSLDNKQA